MRSTLQTLSPLLLLALVSLTSALQTDPSRPRCLAPLPSSNSPENADDGISERIHVVNLLEMNVGHFIVPHVHLFRQLLCAVQEAHLAHTVDAWAVDVRTDSCTVFKDSVNDKALDAAETVVRRRLGKYMDKRVLCDILHTAAKCAGAYANLTHPLHLVVLLALNDDSGLCDIKQVFAVLPDVHVTVLWAHEHQPLTHALAAKEVDYVTLHLTNDYTPRPDWSMPNGTRRELERVAKESGNRLVSALSARMERLAAWVEEKRRREGEPENPLAQLFRNRSMKRKRRSTVTPNATKATTPTPTLSTTTTTAHAVEDSTSSFPDQFDATAPPPIINLSWSHNEEGKDENELTIDDFSASPILSNSNSNDNFSTTIITSTKNAPNTTSRTLTTLEKIGDAFGDRRTGLLFIAFIIFTLLILVLAVVLCVCLLWPKYRHETPRSHGPRRLVGAGAATTGSSAAKVPSASESDPKPPESDASAKPSERLFQQTRAPPPPPPKTAPQKTTTTKGAEASNAPTGKTVTPAAPIVPPAPPVSNPMAETSVSPVVPESGASVGEEEELAPGIQSPAPMTPARSQTESMMEARNGLSFRNPSVGAKDALPPELVIPPVEGIPRTN